MNADRTQQRFERFAQLRSAYPDMEYENIMAWIHDEEVDADEAGRLQSLGQIDDGRGEEMAYEAAHNL